jgi:mRNA-degrading endonuclease RelE of RelBE toxin-antitoxin system
LAEPAEWSKDAQKDLRSLDLPTAQRIIKTILRFTGTGQGDIKRLQGIDPPLYRLKAAKDYRVFFRLNPETATMTVLRIRHRREAYR